MMGSDGWRGVGRKQQDPYEAASYAEAIKRHKCYTTQGPNVKKRGERRFDEPVVSLRGDVAEKKRASKKGQIKDS